MWIIFKNDEATFDGRPIWKSGPVLYSFNRVDILFKLIANLLGNSSQNLQNNENH